MGRVLVVAAHPDDEVLGPGATVVKHVKSGDEVRAIVLSEGATSRYSHDMVSSLRAAGVKSAEVLGYERIDFLGFPDQRLDTVPLIEVTQEIETHVRDFEPTVVYTHSMSDVNADHGVTAQAAWTACRPYAAPSVELMACFDTASSTEWAWPGRADHFEPNHFVDVTATMSTKLAAMAQYDDELRDYPHPRSLRSLAERAAYWGSRAGMGAAEPFVILRSRG